MKLLACNAINEGKAISECPDYVIYIIQRCNFFTVITSYQEIGGKLADDTVSLLLMNNLVFSSQSSRLPYFNPEQATDNPILLHHIKIFEASYLKITNGAESFFVGTDVAKEVFAEVCPILTDEMVGPHL